MSSRIYLDWNATAPLRPEAREAMLAAMDVVGNPSSVHAEGRAARGIVEKARGQVAALVGCEPSEVVFTSGATEANNLVFRCEHAWHPSVSAEIEHDSVVLPLDHAEVFHGEAVAWAAPDRDGVVAPGAVIAAARPYLTGRQTTVFHADRPAEEFEDLSLTVSIGAANGETGVLQPLTEIFSAIPTGLKSLFHSDITQALGRTVPIWASLAHRLVSCSSHKIGGPKGVGTLAGRVTQLDPIIRGGGQEMGRRSGTENVIGIAGFGAAAEAALRDLEDGVWERVEKLRDDLEHALVSAAPDIIIFGKDAPRLPNTSCFAVPGWKGETQVMQMDLAGFAISSGSACSSGKVGPSRVLRAMGYDETTASSAVRVSMGPTTTEAEVMAFAETWTDFYRRRRAAA